MSAWVSKQSGNWTRASNNADSPWYDAGAQTALSSYPGGAGAGDTVTIGDGITASQNITLDGDPPNSIASITQGDNTSYITVASARAITLTANPGIAYGGTNTTGFFRIGTGGTLTITHDIGAGTSAITNSAAGHAIVTSGSGSFAVSNSGGVAASQSSNGRAISCGSTGTVTITGDLNSTGSGDCCIMTAAGTVTWNGGATGSNGYCYRQSTGTCTWTPGVVTQTGGTPIWAYGGTLNFAAVPVTVTASSGAVNVPVRLSNGTFNWTGSQSLAASSDCWIGLDSGTLNLATASAALALANSGTFVIIKTGGTLNTADAGAGAASIVNQTATSYAAILGGSDANKGIITYPAGGGLLGHGGMNGGMNA